MKKTYELTPAQKMHYRWIREYKTQQVAGLSIVASIKADIDFVILKKAILLEYQRYGCMRVRFTKPDKDGEVQQYLSEEKITDIPLKDLSAMTMEEADEVMQSWAYETFDGDNIPMCEVFLMKLPEGYNGFFIHMDHRLIDSCGVVVMTNDIMALYTHFKFGSYYPEDLADYTEQLTRDLEKEQNPKRFARDKKFWDEQLEKFGELLYSDIQGPEILERARKKHRKKSLRSADIERKKLFVKVKDYPLEQAPTKAIIDFCLNHNLSITNLLLLGLRTYLSKQNGGQEDISIQNFISRRSTRDEWTSGGSRTIMFPCRTVISPDTTFMEAAYIIQNTQNGIYMHAGYGMSECSLVITSNNPAEHKKGSIGKPLKNVEISFKDGEILVRGSSVMKGYYKMPEETTRAIWFSYGGRIPGQFNHVITNCLRPTQQRLKPIYRFI